MIMHLIFISMSWVLTTAMPWDGPKSTDATNMVTAISSNTVPMPTAITELLKRDALPANDCGFIGGNESIVATCSAQSSCVWITDLYVVGCCATTPGLKNCQFFTECIDINSPATAAVGDPLVYTWYLFLKFFNLYTNNSASLGTSTCFQNRYPSNYHQWGCGYNATTIELTYANMTMGAPTIQQVFVGTDDLLNVATTVIVPAPATVTASAVPANYSSNSKTGTILGATIGGSTILVLGALIITWRVFRLRKPKPSPDNAAPSNPITSPPQLPSEQFGYHPSVGYYDQNQLQLVPMSPNSHKSIMSIGSPQPPMYHGQPYSVPGSPPPQEDAICSYPPPSSPGQISVLEAPKEMDGGSFGGSDVISRKPLAG